MDTGHKLNVHKSFRRRPGRLLNVLCTFNLRPVFTGKGLLKYSCVITYTYFCCCCLSTRSFIRKPSFCLSLIFPNIMLENQAEIFLIFFLTFISLFSLTVYLVKTNHKCHFLTYFNMCVSPTLQLTSKKIVYNNKQPT